MAREENSQSTTKVFGVSQIRKSKGKRFKLAICEIAITILTVDSRKTRGERQSFCFKVSQIEKSKGKRFKLAICEITKRSGPSDHQRLWTVDQA
jgi:hypothetical protein